MNPKKIVIIGGGISGLSLAFRLTELSKKQKTALDITVLELKDRFGGVIETEARNGFLFEGGPDSFISEKPWALDLCRRLGLDDQIIETESGFRKSFIVRENRLVPVPKGLYLTIPTNFGAFFKMPFVSWPGKFKTAAEFLMPPRKTGADESVANFVRRHFGEEVLRSIAQPMVAGIYTSDPEKLSVKAAMPDWFKIEQEYGSLIRGYRNRAKTHSASGPRYSLFLSLRGGVQILIETLLRKMPGVSLRSSAKIKKIQSLGGWRVVFEDGSAMNADMICLAIPAPRAACLLDEVDIGLGRDLERIPYESVATLNFGFHRNDVRHPLDGFGFVVPVAEKKSIVGCTFSSVKFSERAPGNFVLLRAFAGGALQREIFNLGDTDLKKTVLRDLGALLGIQAEPVFCEVRRYPQSMPQYHVGHLELVTAIEQKAARHPGLYLTGNAFRGIGLPDCIRQAEETAERMMTYAQLECGASH